MNILQLTDHVKTFGNRHFHIFALGSKPTVLIEGSVSAAASVAAMQLKKEDTTDSLNRLVIMHAHFDHVCGTQVLLRHFPQLKVAASSIAKDILQNPKILRHFTSEDLSTAQMLRQKGMAEDNVPKFKPEPIRVDEIIQEDTIWKFEPRLSLQFYSAPGHSPCSMAAYLPEEEVLFTSDAAGFFNNDLDIFPLFFEDYDKYFQTINRLSQLPVSILAGGHNNILQGAKQVKEFWVKTKAITEKTREKIVTALKKGQTEQEVAEQLFNECYIDNMRVYSDNNMRICCDYLVKRAKATI